MFECLSGCRASALRERNNALAMARGAAAYPWKSPPQSVSWERSPYALRQIVMQCLSAAPQHRPSADALVSRLEAVVAHMLPAQRSPTLRMEGASSGHQVSSFSELAAQMGRHEGDSDGLEIGQSPFSTLQSTT